MQRKKVKVPEFNFLLKAFFLNIKKYSTLITADYATLILQTKHKITYVFIIRSESGSSLRKSSTKRSSGNLSITPFQGFNTVHKNNVQKQSNWYWVRISEMNVEWKLNELPPVFILSGIHPAPKSCPSSFDFVTGRLHEFQAIQNKD